MEGKVILVRSYADSSLYRLWADRVSRDKGPGPALRQMGGSGELSLASVVSQLSSAQNNPYAKVASLGGGVAYADPLHNEFQALCPSAGHSQPRKNST